MVLHAQEYLKLYLFIKINTVQVELLLKEIWESLEQGQEKQEALPFIS